MVFLLWRYEDAQPFSPRKLLLTFDNHEDLLEFVIVAKRYTYMSQPITHNFVFDTTQKYFIYNHIYSSFLKDKLVNFYSLQLF